MPRVTGIADLASSPTFEEESHHGGSQATTFQHPGQEASHALEAQGPRSQRLQPLQQPQAAASDLSQLRLL